VGPPSEEARYAWFGLFVEKNRDNAPVALLVVDVIIEKAAFPVDAPSFLGRYVAFDAPAILDSANADDQVRTFSTDLVIAPAGPVDDLGFVELVKFNIDAMVAQRNR